MISKCLQAIQRVAEGIGPRTCTMVEKCNKKLIFNIFHKKFRELTWNGLLRYSGSGVNSASVQSCAGMGYLSLRRPENLRFPSYEWNKSLWRLTLIYVHFYCCFPVRVLSLRYAIPYSGVYSNCKTNKIKVDKFWLCIQKILKLLFKLKSTNFKMNGIPQCLEIVRIYAREYNRFYEIKCLQVSISR